MRVKLSYPVTPITSARAAGDAGDAIGIRVILIDLKNTVIKEKTVDENKDQYTVTFPEVSKDKDLFIKAFQNGTNTDFYKALLPISNINDGYNAPVLTFL